MFEFVNHFLSDFIQMVVDEMNLSTTIFLRYDNQKIMYSNSVLATKLISNWDFQFVVLVIFQFAMLILELAPQPARLFFCLLKPVATYYANKCNFQFFFQSCIFGCGRLLAVADMVAYATIIFLQIFSGIQYFCNLFQKVIVFSQKNFKLGYVLKKSPFKYIIPH